MPGRAHVLFRARVQPHGLESQSGEDASRVLRRGPALWKAGRRVRGFPEGVPWQVEEWPAWLFAGAGRLTPIVG